MGHNLLPHTHHSQADHHLHSHNEQNLLDNLLDHHEHSSDFGDDLVDIFCLSDNNYSLKLTTGLSSTPFLGAIAYHNKQLNNIVLLSSRLAPSYLSTQDHIPISEDTYVHTLRGPPTI